MIRCVFRCDAQHKFEGWFRSEADCERFLTPGETRCPICEVAALKRPDVVVSRPEPTAPASGLVLQ